MANKVYKVRVGEFKVGEVYKERGIWQWHNDEANVFTQYPRRSTLADIKADIAGRWPQYPVKLISNNGTEAVV